MENQDYICLYCGRICKNKNSLAQHSLYCKSNPNRLEKHAWNLGKTKLTDELVKQTSDTLRSRLTGYQHYERYLADNSIAYGQQNMQQYKKYFLEEQGHRCAVCGNLDTWQDKQLVFVLDHIDGNSDNNNRENLRLVCPNCDSQLPTFKSKNKKSARAKYAIRNIERRIENMQKGKL